jgi:hypothetical protein
MEFISRHRGWLLFHSPVSLRMSWSSWDACSWSSFSTSNRLVDVEEWERTVCCRASDESDCIVVLSLYRFTPAEFTPGDQNDE